MLQRLELLACHGILERKVYLEPSTKRRIGIWWSKLVAKYKEAVITWSSWIDNLTDLTGWEHVSLASMTKYLVEHGLWLFTRSVKKSP